MNPPQSSHLDVIELARSVYARAAAMDIDALESMFGDEVVMELPFAPDGWTNLYEGKVAVLDFQRRAAQSFASFTMTVDRVLASNPLTAVVEARSVGTTIKGAPYENRYCTILEFDDDGLVARWTEYYDPIAVSAAFPRSWFADVATPDDIASFSASDGIVTLRAWSRDDASFIVDASVDPAIQRYSLSHDHRGIPGPPPSSDEAEATIDQFAANWQASTTTGVLTSVGFAITEAEGGNVVGQCGIDHWSKDGVAQIGYWLAPDARGHGYATRAVVLLTNWLFERGATRVFLTIVAGNDASVAVARRAGFVHEGTMRAHALWHGQPCDVMWFAALADEWAFATPRDPGERQR